MAAVLGIDYGSKRVGLARASTEGRLATPLATLANNDQLFEQLRQLIAKEQVEQLVVGLPRGLDGQETAQTTAARQFAKTLAEETSLKPVLQDEALTSATGQRRYRGATPDSAAAAMILQDYLDGL